MSSVKLILRTSDQKKDGTCPLAIRIIKDRKPRYIFTGQYIKQRDWDKEEKRVKKSHPNSKRINNLLIKKLAEANDKVLELEIDQRGITSKEIKDKLKKTGSNVSFFDLASQRISNYQKKGTYSVGNAEQSIVNNLKKFVKKEELHFQDISVSFLERFKVFCASDLGQSSRTITNQLIFIRTMFNIAIKDGIVDGKYYPFAGDKVKIRVGSGLKIGLTKEEVAKIESLKLEHGTSIWHARNVWLFSFYFAGIRISDVLKLKWSDFNDDRLNYVMYKNEKPVSLKIPNKANEIIKFYQKEQDDLENYVFPWLNQANQKDKRDIFRKSRNASRLFNSHLKKIANLSKINKNLSNHIARHSFGNIAGDKIHPLMLQKLYRHSDLKTTINYQANFIHKDADEALDSVVDF